MLRVDSLATFTARGGLTLDELWQAFEAFREAAPDGYTRDGYVAVPEMHKGGGANDGKFHLHVAIPKGARFIHYGEASRLWSDVLKRTFPGRWGEESAGNIDLRATGRHHKRWARAKLAHYITKYIIKDAHEGELNRKRYSVSRHIAKPRRVKITLDPSHVRHMGWLAWKVAHALGNKRFPTVPKYHDIPGRTVVTTQSMIWSVAQEDDASDWLPKELQGLEAASPEPSAPPASGPGEAEHGEITRNELWSVVEELLAAAENSSIDTLVSEYLSCTRSDDGCYRLAPLAKPSEMDEAELGTALEDARFAECVETFSEVFGAVGVMRFVADGDSG